MTFSFELREFSEAELPNSTVAVQTALNFMSQVKSAWTKGKFYSDGQVQTYHHTASNGDFWMARESNHKDVSFEEFRSAILLNHTENEVKYIPLLDSFKRLEPVTSPETPDAHDWESLLVHYKFPKFFSDREMTVWLLAIQPNEDVKEFLVISLPSNRPVTDSEHVTQAYYCSIEHVKYNEQEQQVEWLMAQTSDAKGNIPRWIQNKSVTSSVVEDVPHFISWAKKQREVSK
ncbi:hypothetical protein AWJ20_3191 [Sugiyamaella lignohabitans]|uniref:DUF3074 domain-containing protein n=1 Tax=Sugiyamaella lignohabitans TaxID=796027 RepID=A0A167FQC7_9ASCO|nr:uncharacterized protein AWJ20_3191 [Sugiyamaella lignohabitans]ANB15563.1 hypothetical protein AWJ20_3191 [Sugiyamaella lignohabitans]